MVSRPCRWVVAVSSFLAAITLGCAANNSGEIAAAILKMSASIDASGMVWKDVMMEFTGLAVKMFDVTMGDNATINEPVTGWILAASIPVCFLAYTFSHRSGWFRRGKAWLRNDPKPLPLDGSSVLRRALGSGTGSI